MLDNGDLRQLAGAWRNSYAHANTNSYTHAHTYTNTNAHADRYTDTHANTHAYSDTYSYSNSYADTNTNTNAHANIHTCTGNARLNGGELVICRSISAWAQTGVGCRF